MAKEYFSNLNYTLGNEDTRLEVEIVNKIKPKKIFAIAGCGSRALPLLCCEPEELICIDIVKQQLHITELRHKTIEKLCYSEFLIFWGFPPYDKTGFSDRRKEMFQRLNLSPDAFEYFAHYFDNLNWGSLLYEGKWEKTFQVFSKIVKSILGNHTHRALSFDDVSSQLQYYNNYFPKMRWRFIIYLLGNKSVFNHLLYKGDFIKKNVPESMFQYYNEGYERLFSQGPLAESFFMHLSFHGKIINPKGNTIEAEENIFLSCKKSLLNGSVVSLHEKDLVTMAKELEGKDIDFASLSDVPSYFSGALEKNFLQYILPMMNQGGVVVLRNYLREPVTDTTGYDDITAVYSQEIRRERIQMYKIKIYQKI